MKIETITTLDSIPKGKFHSCIATTYSLDFYFWEYSALRVLRHKGIYNISILADARMLEKSIGNLTTGTNALGNLYDIVAVPCSGAFHPKILFLAGYKEVLILIGSGNLTSGGHGKNQELWTSFYYKENDTDARYFINEVWTFLSDFYTSQEGISLKKKKWIKDNCTLIKGKKQSLVKNNGYLFFTNTNQSIFEQLKNALAKEIVKKITIISPFYDLGGGLVSKLKDTFPEAIINCVVQEMDGQPPIKMPEQKGVIFHSWSKAKNNKRKGLNRTAKLHAKCFYLESDDKSFVLVGSANATLPAFGIGKKENEEASVFFQWDDSDFLKQLGISISKKSAIQLKDIEWKAANTEASYTTLPTCRILSVDRIGYSIKIKVDGLGEGNSNHHKVMFYNAWNEGVCEKRINVQKQKIMLDLSKEKNISDIRFVSIIDNDANKVSNTAIINNVEKQRLSDPTPESRNLTKLIDKIEGDEENTSDLLDFLHNLNLNNEDDTSESIPKVVSGEKRIGAARNSISVNLSYSEFIALSGQKNPFLNSDFLGNFASVRVFGAILDQVSRSHLREEEEAAENEYDESEGNGGKDNDSNVHYLSVRNNSELNKLREKILVIYDNYISQIYDRQNKGKDSYEINIVDLSLFMLMLNMLLRLVENTVKVGKEEREVNIVDFNGSLNEWNNIKIMLYDLVGTFALQCQRGTGFHNSDDSFLNQKTKLYIKKAIYYSLTAVAILKYNALKKGFYESKWIHVLLLNILDAFKVDAAAIKMDTLNQSINDFRFYEKFNQVELREALLWIERKVNKYPKRKFRNKKSGKIIMTPDWGICRVTKYTPFEIKIARPGFPFSDYTNDFEMEEYYDF